MVAAVGSAGASAPRRNYKMVTALVSNANVKVDNIVITPKGHRVGIMLPNIWLRIVNSEIETV